MLKNLGNLRITLITATLIFIADQMTKWMIISSIPRGFEKIVFDGFFSLVHVQNRGAAFGFLNRSDIDWQVWLFSVVTIIASVVILRLTCTYPTKKFHILPISLGFVLGGALGNMLDRIRFHSVTDFLDFYLGDYHWPAFNLADSAICCGAAVAFIILWKMPTKHQGN